MLVFDSARYAWRRFQARLHGHEHVDPMEMSSYGVRTAFGVGLIHGIGCEAVAEGIESQAQADVMRVIGCDVIQGYAIAAPMDERAFIAWSRAEDRQRTTG